MMSVLLAALVYVFFYLLKMPLSPKETVITAFCCTATVFGIRTFVNCQTAGNSAAPNRQFKRPFKRHRRPTRHLILICGVACSFEHSRVLQVQAQSSNTAPTPTDSQSILACSADHSEIPTDGSVTLRVYSDANQSPSDVSWTVTQGAIERYGGKSTWNLKGFPAGVYRAEAMLKGSTGAPVSCAVDVVVSDPVRDSQLVAGQSLITPGTPEPKGFGLYSYVLFGSHPDNENRTRYLNTIEALLRYLEEADDLDRYFDSAQINFTVIPVIARPTVAVTANWILAHYDFVRARSMLSKLGGASLEGPYIVSVISPLNNSSKPFLFQDLSTVPTEPPELLSWWIREFISQSTQRATWDHGQLKLFALRMRTTIAILAQGAPAIRKGVNALITLRQPSAIGLSQ